MWFWYKEEDNSGVHWQMSEWVLTEFWNRSPDWRWCTVSHDTVNFGFDDNAQLRWTVRGAIRWCHCLWSEILISIYVSKKGWKMFMRKAEGEIISHEMMIKWVRWKVGRRGGITSQHKAEQAVNGTKNFGNVSWRTELCHPWFCYIK